MKTKRKELDVDFIGGSTPLTNEEEKRIIEIIKNNSTKKIVTAQKIKAKLTAKKKVTL